MVRCLIMMEIASLSGYKVLETGIVNKREGEHPTKWEAYSYSYQTDGLYKNTYERKLMPGKKGEEGVHYAKSERVGQELITDDPDEICEILFGVDSANMLTWEDAWNAAKNVGIFDNPKKEEMFKKKLKKGFEPIAFLTFFAPVLTFSQPAFILSPSQDSLSRLMFGTIPLIDEFNWSINSPRFALSM